MRFFLISFCAFVCFACTSTPTVEESAEQNEIDIFFPDFPECQYKTLALGDSVQVLIEHLRKEGYLEFNHQRGHWKNEKSETEVILPDAPVAYEFKVFFYSIRDINKSEKFKHFFEDRATESHFGNEFSVYKVSGSSKEFNVTLFEQPEFLRLNFELKSKH